VIFLFDIVFQSGDFYNDSSFWEDLFISAAGAFLGIWGAWGIYWLQRRNDRKDTLIYTTELIRNVIDKMSKQYQHLLDYSTINAGNMTGIPLLKYEGSQSLARLVERIDQQKFYHAFLREIGRTLQSRKDFNNIYHQLDFLYNVLNQVQDYLPKELQSLADKKKEFVANVGSAEEMMVRILGGSADQLLKDFINKKLDVWSEAKKERKLINDLELAMREFGDPVAKHFIGQYRNNASCQEVAFIFRRAGGIFDIIKQQSDGISETFKAYADNFKQSLDILEGATVKLFAKFPRMDGATEVKSLIVSGLKK